VLQSGGQDRDFVNGEPIEGERLSVRLARGPLNPADALRYAIEIGSELAKAHLRGRVHGALSPSAILLTYQGARILPPLSADESHAAYRSPEEVRGLEPDWRSDIFAYGAILYEMSGGRRAFPGDGGDLDNAILLKPPVALISHSPVHAAMEGVIAGCLVKDPAQRRQRIRNAAVELKLAGQLARAAEQRARELVNKPRNPAPQPPLHVEAAAKPSTGVRWRLAAVVSLVVALAALAAAAAIYLARRPMPSVLRFAIAAPEHNSYPGTPSISPDGRYLAFSAIAAEGQRMLWLRPLDEIAATVIPGTDGGFAPFWSPDGQSIGFFANRSLKRVRVHNEAGGPGAPEIVCPVEAMAGGGAWSADGTILFAPGLHGGLYKVSAQGGQPQAYTTLEASRSEHAHLWPQFLPDGRHFIFFGLTGIAETTGVYAAALDHPGHQFLFAAETNAVFSPPAGSGSRDGYLLYLRDRDLVARRFNSSRLVAEAEPFALAPDIGAVRSLSLAPISVSSNAILAYQSTVRSTRQLVWMDRTGKQLGSPSQPGEWGPPRISPDGTRAIVAKLGAEGEHANLWILTASGAATQLTSTPAHEGSPIWAPDGTRIAFFSNRAGGFDIYMQAATPAAQPELLYKSPFPKYPTDWSGDGRYMLFGSLADSTNGDVWALSLAERRANPILDTVHSEAYAALSADGHWLAFQSDESGVNQVYVQAFDPNSSGTKRRWQVSTSGGGLPRWSTDPELVYMTSSGRMMSVKVHPQGSDFQFDEARLLFETRPIPRTWNLYDVSRDGQRFLVNLPLEWSSASPITVVTNWTEKLKP